MPTVRRCQVVPKTGTTSLTPPGRTKAKPSPTSRNMESAKINRPGLTKRGGGGKSQWPFSSHRGLGARGRPTRWQSKTSTGLARGRTIVRQYQAPQSWQKCLRKTRPASPPRSPENKKRKLALPEGLGEGSYSLTPADGPNSGEKGDIPDSKTKREKRLQRHCGKTKEETKSNTVKDQQGYHDEREARFGVTDNPGANSTNLETALSV